MNKYFLSFIILGLGVAISSAILITNALAQNESAGAINIQYPVEELGNCQSEAACKNYCDKPGNIEACLAFAEKNNLMTSEELEQAKNFIAAGAKGPGGCTGKESCEEYCNDVSKIDECVAYAEKNNLMSAKDLGEAKKVQAAIKRGVKPPACGNKKSCDTYCSNSDHMEECISFGIEAGFLQGKELEESQKMLAALKRGVKPPPCGGKEACDEYCQQPDNMEVCMNFAMEAGFMSEQEKQDSQKMLEALKKGIKPPNCKGKEECDVYCSEDAHFEECMKFAEAAGFMTPEEAEMARKTGGKGPGDCKGKEECEAFCNNPDNQETCFNFAKEHGLISDVDLQQMEQGKQQLQQALNSAPQAAIDCLNSAFGAEQVEKFRSGVVMPPREIGDKMGECFRNSMGPDQNMQPGTTGPGGCKTPEECQVYCQANPTECQNSQGSNVGSGMPPGSGVPGITPMPGGSGGQTGPGGCQTPEECQSYCQNNPQECQGQGPGPGEGQMPPQNFQPPQDFQPQEGFQPPTDQQMMPPPPMEQMAPPPPTEPAPPATLNPGPLFGWMLKVFGITQ